MNTILTALAVVLMTALVAFSVATCWSLLGGLVTYLIALLMGGTLIYCWSNDNEDVPRDTDV